MPAKAPTFGSLAIGETFDFVNPAPTFPGENSYSTPCVKIGRLKYRTLVPHNRHMNNRVGTIRVTVYHIGEFGDLARQLFPAEGF